MRTINAVIGSPLLAIVVFASPASAEESHTHSLKGDFAISGGAGCVVSQALVSPTGVTLPPPGFNGNLTPRGPVIPTNFSISGIRTFNRDGTGSLAGRTVTVAQGATQAHDISGQFTYSLASDGTLTIDQGPIESVAVAGPRVGERSRVTDLQPLSGISQRTGTR